MVRTGGDTPVVILPGWKVPERLALSTDLDLVFV